METGLSQMVMKKYLNKAESDVVFSNILVFLREKSGGRDTLKFPVFAKPLDKAVVFLFVRFGTQINLVG